GGVGSHHKRLQGCAAGISAHQHEGGGVSRPVHAENRLIADNMQLPYRDFGANSEIAVDGDDVSVKLSVDQRGVCVRIVDIQFVGGGLVITGIIADKYVSDPGVVEVACITSDIRVVVSCCVVRT